MPHASPARQLLPLLLAIATLLTACPRDVPPPKNALRDPAQLRAAVDARVETLKSARFKRVVLDFYGKTPDGKTERVKVRQLLLVSAPDRLRVQTRLPGTNEIMQLLVSDGRAFAMHDRQSNRYYKGRPTRASINRLLPVDLSARDVIRVMLGGAPWDRALAESEEADLHWDRASGQYELTVPTRRKGSLSITVRPTDYAVTAVTERDAKNKVIYAYTTDDWKRFGPASLPRFRRFVWPAKDLDFSLDVGETQVNVELPEILFSFPPPPGSQIIPLDQP